VAAFEQGSLSRSEWHHRTHLAVAFWYLSRLEETEAKQRICQGIRHYNHCQGIPNTPDSGYHETLTLFWAGMIKLFLENAQLDCTRVELVNQLLAMYGCNKDLWRDYYSFDLLKSPESRRSWVQPDRKSLSRENTSY
jgi:hypothetical protein